jgi:hypothetical protein
MRHKISLRNLYSQSQKKSSPPTLIHFISSSNPDSVLKFLRVCWKKGDWNLSYWLLLEMNASRTVCVCVCVRLTLILDKQFPIGTVEWVLLSVPATKLPTGKQILNAVCLVWMYRILRCNHTCSRAVPQAWPVACWICLPTQGLKLGASRWNSIGVFTTQDLSNKAEKILKDVYELWEGRDNGLS